MAFASWLRGVLFCLLIPSLIFSSVLSGPALGQTHTSEQSRSEPSPKDFTAIQHFVFLVKENRTFDDYFGTFPGANGTTTGLISTGQVIPLGHMPDVTPRDLSHDWIATRTGMDFGKMDKFDLILGFGGGAARCNSNGDYLCYSQVTQQDIPNYWNYAQYFALADNHFSSITAESFANHMYTVAAQSGGAIADPSPPTFPGCDARTGTYVTIVEPDGELDDVFPCFTFQTLANSLQDAGISWKYYSSGESSWNPLDAIQSIRESSLWNTNIESSTQFIDDALNGNLAAVNWVTGTGLQMEHPTKSICNGENWTVQLLNAIMEGPDWDSTAVFITWDEFGGLYDHVPPPNLDEWGLGPRVPLLIISPYAKSGYISHTQYEFSSVLKTIEERFSLPFLTSRDQNANDLLDSFDFTQSPLPPLILQERQCSPVSTANLDFLPELVNTPSGAKVVTVSNFSDTTNLNISSIQLQGAGFSQTSNCGSSLAPRSMCTVNVTFAPTRAGPATGILTFTDSDPTSPQTVAVTGVGTNLSLTPNPLSFGTKTVAGSITKLATLKNSGTSSVAITNVSISGDYSDTGTCRSQLAPGASCTFRVTYTPTATGTRYGALTITDNDPSSPQLLNLTGIATDISLAPVRLNFGSEGVNTTSPPQSVVLTNLGSTSLNISNVSVLGSLGQVVQYDFSQTSNCIGSLAPGANCTISVTFTPIATGKVTFTLLITDSEGDSPQSVTLVGIGT